MAPDARFTALRDAIQEVDAELLGLVKRRMALVEQVAKAKLDAAYPFRDPLREDQVLQRVRETAADLDLDPHEIERIYRLVMAMSVARQQGFVRSLPEAPLRITYQGVEGSYSHLAAQRRYAGRRGGALLTGCVSFRGAADEVREGRADFALLPIENTTAGSINETYDLLAEGELVITAEVIAGIEHCLLTLGEVPLARIRRVLSHPQALLQCETFLAQLPAARPEVEFDTAGAARRVRELGDPTVAAIASESAAALFGLEVARRGIQSQERNATRFVEVAKHAVPCPPEVPCKTSLLLAVSHQPGALGELLREFSRRSVNLTKLESRPVPESPWSYRFYLDLEGHAASEPVSAAIEASRAHTVDLRILGTYPRDPESTRAGS